jgi:4-hydroxy-3-polyprenylbenzoate decarboxylase
MEKSQRIVVGITGSSGAILGIRLLKALRPTDVETHLVISSSARLTIEQETNWSQEEVCSLADVVYENSNVGAAIASGSFPTQGMVIIPCSVKTLSAVANSYTDNLLTRAADVTLKEGRPLILVVREAPLHPGHLRLFKLAANAGAVIFPPVPAFYTHPYSVDDIVQNIIGRILNRLGVQNVSFAQWNGISGEKQTDSRKETLSGLLALPAMTLATVGKDHSPHAASLYFVSDESINLYFLSIDTGQHGQDLVENNNAAVTIQPAVSDWRDIKGVQLRGRVEAVQTETEQEKAWTLYTKKFPFVEGLKGIVTENLFFVFHPDWIRVVDNAQGFGHKDEWAV